MQCSTCLQSLYENKSEIVSFSNNDFSDLGTSSANNFNDLENI